MYKYFKYLFFTLPPERAHYLAMDLFAGARKVPGMGTLLRGSFRAPFGKNVKLLGLDFPNPVGLAAGFDKNAKWLHILKDLGFGSVEVGTVTPKPQSGNEKPRLFRLVKDRALINRMGFNNEGVDAMVTRLKRRPEGLIVGANIGKNKLTPNEDAVSDYLFCLERLYVHVDYIVVNVSSPNTPGLRALQEKGFLTELFGKIAEFRNLQEIQKPVLLKIAPDLENSALDEIMEVLRESAVDGIVATNTTISREGLKTNQKDLESMGAGGLSGAPLAARSTDVIAYLRKGMGPDYPIIGVGGIETDRDMREKMNAGADLIQVYTGFIYQGPSIVRKILR